MNKKGFILFSCVSVLLIITFFIVQNAITNKQINQVIYTTKTTTVISTTKKTVQILYKLNNVPILMYHSVNDNPIGSYDLSIKNNDFENQIKYLSENGYTPLILNELQNKEKVKKPVIITFDDGYTDNFTNAYKILKKYNFKATFFVSVNFINAKDYLTKNQILEMTDLISFQSHTLSHDNLDKLSASNLENTLKNSKKVLYKITGKPVFALSYPNGKYNAKVIEITKKYYDYAVTMNGGLYNKADGNYKIRRIFVRRQDSLNEFISKIKGLH